MMLRVVVVGVCASGKSELVRRLATRGIDAHAVAQEHSHVPELWRHQGDPDLLVYLQASTRAVRRRGRRNLDATALAEQRRRLAHARANAHLSVQTDHVSPDEIEAFVLRAILARSMTRASRTAVGQGAGQCDEGGSR